MAKYKLMQAQELANFILSQDIDSIFNFATSYPEDMDLVPEDDDINNYGWSGIECWYGVKRIKTFDSEGVIIGQWGGNDLRIFEIGITTEYLVDELEDYIYSYINGGTTVKGLVCVEISE